MNPRVLAFPAAVAVVASLSGCEGVSLTDPSVKECRADTIATTYVLPNGEERRALVIKQPWEGHCRPKAA